MPLTTDFLFLSAPHSTIWFSTIFSMRKPLLLVLSYNTGSMARQSLHISPACWPTKKHEGHLALAYPVVIIVASHKRYDVQTQSKIELFVQQLNQINSIKAIAPHLWVCQNAHSHITLNVTKCKVICKIADDFKRHLAEYCKYLMKTRCKFRVNYLAHKGTVQVGQEHKNELGSINKV